MGPQAERIKELLKKYADFTYMSQEEKTKAIRLCGILAYLEIADMQHMTIEGCINGIIKFLDKIREQYIKENENKDDKDDNDNVIIE